MPILHVFTVALTLAAPGLADARPLVVGPEPAAAERLFCLDDDDIEGRNLCLAKCYEDDFYYDVVGYAMRRTRANWRKCRRAARNFCEVYDWELEESCWGAYGDPDDWGDDDDDGDRRGR